MKRFEAIVQSESAPNISTLWLKDNKIWHFDGGWKAIEGNYDATEDNNIDKLRHILINENTFNNVTDQTITLKHNRIREILNNSSVSSLPAFQLSNKNGLLDYIDLYIRNISAFPSLINRLTFNLDFNEDNITVLDYINEHFDYPMDSLIPVYIGSSDILNCPAIYYNAHIYTILNGVLIIYNINTNGDAKGTITRLKTVDLTLLPTYIDLELGNSASIKAYNLEQLQKVTGTQFFVHADYGIGVGSFNSGTGGETTIQTAGGDRVHYLITSEGECVKQADRFEHSELFFNLGKVDVSALPKTVSITNSVEIDKFKKATSLAFEASNGTTFIDDVSMNQVSVNTLTKQRIYTSPDLICVQDQDWNYIKATATTTNNKIDIYLETI